MLEFKIGLEEPAGADVTAFVIYHTFTYIAESSELRRFIPIVGLGKFLALTPITATSYLKNTRDGHRHRVESF